MRTDRDRAEKFRRAGMSYRAIEAKLGIPRSTLSEWFANLPWSQGIRSRSQIAASVTNGERLTKFNRARWSAARAGHRKDAIKEFKKLFKDPLFIAGVMLYWGEGTNRPDLSVAKITNTDPRMIALFVKFLIRVCRVAKKDIRVAIIRYPDIPQLACERFWSSVTGLPRSQFHRTQCIQGKSTRRKLKNGTCMVIVSSRALKDTILTWIDLLQRKLNPVDKLNPVLDK